VIIVDEAKSVAELIFDAFAASARSTVFLCFINRDLPGSYDAMRQGWVQALQYWAQAVRI
jgi:hypothetical protein